MGDPKFPHKKYSTPRHPWEKDRIDAEKEVVKKYGLKNKRELWKSQALLDSFRTQARGLQARLRYQDPHANDQFRAMIKRLNRYNILGDNASLDDILSLTIEDILDRRLQSVVYRKNMSRTLTQARQMIAHGHITMNGRRVTIPGVLVEATDEDSIIYTATSPYQDELHPIRQAIAGAREEEEEAEEEPEKVEKPPRRRRKPQVRKEEEKPVKEEEPRRKPEAKAEEKASKSPDTGSEESSKVGNDEQ